VEAHSSTAVLEQRRVRPVLSEAGTSHPGEVVERSAGAWGLTKCWRKVGAVPLTAL